MANNNEQDVMMNSFPEANDGKYIYGELEGGQQVKIPKASVASIISTAIKNDPNLLANVNFGAKTSSELASVVAGNMTFEGENGSANTLEKLGAFPVSSTTTNLPINKQGCVFNLEGYSPNKTAGLRVQFFVAQGDSTLWVRTRYSSGTWTAWRTI